MKAPCFVLSCLVSLLLTAVARADEAVTLRTLAGEIPAEVRMIRADNRLGDITVTASEAGFGWEWTLRSTHGARSRLENYAEQCRIEVRQVEGALQILVVRPENPRDGRSHHNGVRRFLAWATLGVVSADEGQVRSDLKLRVPAASLVNLKNAFGSVRVDGTRAAATIECQNGRVELTDIDGAVVARTSFGSLKAERVGPAQLSNQNGNIEAQSIAGALQATTSFGRIKAQDVKGDAVLRNQNGAIEALRITGNLGGNTSFAEMRVAEIGGGVELRGQNARIELKRVSGNVLATTSFGPMHVQDAAGKATLKNQNGKIEAVRVTGDLLAETSFAELRVDEIGGQAQLDCRNGKIEATRVTGGLRAANSFAPMRVRDVGGAVDLRGQNAEIVAADITGDIRAETSFGRMQLQGNGRSFVARNQNGAVEIIANSIDVQRIDASASFASIDVRLPGETKPLIRATTSFGKVKSGFPVLHGDTVSDKHFAEETSALKVSLRGQNGDIRIHQIAAR